ncbi:MULTISPECIES: MarR family winged helix-turn-helix transcriptional regulator [unclassified Sphingobium]|uniref:MarR family winged helix-turn-helix transcriptional regulator n=1 Tax=unclassified Sphingobium TaxID=2611147 RepID=UPI0022250D5C|nr:MULTISPECIES: MarR family transcriptional regulator [unclassified Sphingobium]MCW2393786.1 DNA-binding MarR family transcriptional regulator [Sphingobium sp. B8D3B]MCW2417300.1 DNA-binding MarR family transcriptional regulator [Sphingobium sp. B8D3C]
MTETAVTDADYAILADFRHTLRLFMAFSESRAAAAGLTAQQHQALLAIRAAQPGTATIGYVAERLILKPHSATGLIHRLEALGLLMRRLSVADRRQSLLKLTAKAETILADLSATHREEIRRLRPLLTALLDRAGE